MELKEKEQEGEDKTRTKKQNNVYREARLTKLTPKKQGRMKEQEEE